MYFYYLTPGSSLREQNVQTIRYQYSLQIRFPEAQKQLDVLYIQQHNIEKFPVKRLIKYIFQSQNINVNVAKYCSNNTQEWGNFHKVLTQLTEE